MQADKHTHTGIHTLRHTYRQADTPSACHTVRQAYRQQHDIHTGINTGRTAERQNNKQVSNPNKHT